MFAEVYGLFVLDFGHGRCLIRSCLYYDLVLVGMIPWLGVGYRRASLVIH
jgi:hypothetical protein